MDLDAGRCYRALATRDRRFDGRFFTAVLTTGVYCRPVCPARTPRPENVRFYPCAAAAEEAGFRPCLRCRPEAAPGTPAWIGSPALVGRALRLIGEGGLDGDDLPAFAQRLGVGERQLGRLFATHLGVAPGVVARTRRSSLARRLLVETDLPVSQVALAAGYASLRQFNHALQQRYGETPTALRARSRRSGAAAPGNGIVLRLACRPPFDCAYLLRFLAARAILGQQVTVHGATTLSGRLVARFGEPLPTPMNAALTHLFPSPDALAEADLASIGLPRARAASLSRLAAAVATGELRLDAARAHTGRRTALGAGAAEGSGGLAPVAGLRGDAPLDRRRIDMTITLTELGTPLGDVRVARCDERIVGLGFADGWARIEDWLARRFGPGLRTCAGAAPAVAEALRRYFDAELDALGALALDPGGTTFQRAVWRALQRVPAGRTTFYGAIARAIGAPGAARAVGAACGANPIWLAIPCHRAIGNDGHLTGYAGGLARKRWLLAHEGALPYEERPSSSSAVAFAQR